MSIKLVLLKSGETLITDVKELVSEEKAYAYLFVKPHKVSSTQKIVLLENLEDSESVNREYEITLTPWILLTEEEQIPVSLDYVVTVVDPIDRLKEIYLEKTT